jgi:hypothetical protein
MEQILGPVLLTEYSMLFGETIVHNILEYSSFSSKVSVLVSPVSGFYKMYSLITLSSVAEVL